MFHVASKYSTLLSIKHVFKSLLLIQKYVLLYILRIIEKLKVLELKQNRILLVTMCFHQQIFLIFSTYYINKQRTVLVEI